MLDVTLLRCVSYDRTLALDIEAKFRNPPPKAKRKTKKSYFYPSNFKSSSALTHGLSKPVKAKKKSRPAPTPSESESSPLTEPSDAESTRGIGVEGTSTTEVETYLNNGTGVDGTGEGAIDVQAGMRRVYNSMLRNGYEDFELEDDESTSESDDDLDDLYYP
ncbi:hypothetical protein NMY22_g12626 [Coprinellus aureogranulatus]|nr:hypothetical protein NMY22_g12626 [Coprinellus aureogranulatus]